MSTDPAIEVWEGVDGLWRWRYRGPGGRPNLLSNRSWPHRESAAAAAGIAFPGTPVVVRPFAASRRGDDSRKDGSPPRRMAAAGAGAAVAVALVAVKTVVDVIRATRRLTARGGP
jgi:hypothetical protein